MDAKPNIRRRVLGAAFLGGAILTLIAGQGFLREYLQGVWFLAYWAVCFLLTGAAMVIALIDARDVARGTVRQHRDLLDSTIRDIEGEAKNRRRKLRRN